LLHLLSQLNTDLAGKAASSHTHDDRYYTESEINALVNSITTQSDYIKVDLANAINATGTLYYMRLGKTVQVFGWIVSTATTTDVAGMFPGLPMPLFPVVMRIPVNYNNKFVEFRNDGGLRNFAMCSSTVYFAFSYTTVV